MIDLTPITLEGAVVRLEPLDQEHVPGLARVGLDPDIWRYMLYGNIDTEAKLRGFVQDLLERQSKGADLPFAVIDKETGEPVGCTRYLSIDPRNLAVEVGGTWYGAAYRRTGINTECKYLLLRHAFEAWGCIRVQLKTDLNNVRSQVAIERIGAVKEGVLRNHMIRPDGTVRDSVFYSIIDTEWPAAKARLGALMAS